MEIKGKNWTIKISARFIVAVGTVLGTLIPAIWAVAQHFIH